METAASFEARKAPSSYPANMDQQNLGRTPSRKNRPNELDRVREAAVCASTPNIQGRNRVRQSRQHGSVRGAAGNRCPYRDPMNRGHSSLSRSRDLAAPITRTSRQEASGRLS